jgi:hypothetical protein
MSHKPDLTDVMDRLEQMGALLKKLGDRLDARDAMKTKRPESVKGISWYNWRAAPESAMCAIVEEDGCAYWHTLIPNVDGSWKPRWITIPKEDYFLNGCPWDKSLRQRPSIVRFRRGGSKVTIEREKKGE